jgi:toxin-antitoxin system PIN domain toxin
MIALLDVNVLVALFDPAHPDHDDAHRWFGHNRNRGWATCPITVNGCVRVLSNPAYRTVEATAAEVISHLDVLTASGGHQSWPDSVSILDQSLFRRDMIAGHQKVTDAYLLGLAVRRKGKLVTFDRSIPRQAVIGATPRNLEVLGPQLSPTLSA